MDPSGIDPALEQLLRDADVEPAGPVELVRDYPWSRVLRVPLCHGSVWAKRCGSACAFEPDLLALFAAAGETVGPPLLAARRPWLVTSDAGATLWETGPDEERFAVYGRAEVLYAELQQRWFGRTDELVAVGLQHHRLDDLVPLLERLLEDPLVRGVPEPLAEAEAAEVRANLEFVEQAIAILASAGIPDTIHHDDLHTGNVLVGHDGALSLIDWGDASVAHPFFHFTMAMWVISRDLGDQLDHPSLDRARSDYLAAWTHVAPIEELRDLGAVAEYLGAIVRAESWCRGMADADAESLARFGGQAPQWLRGLARSDDGVIARRARAAVVGRSEP